MKRIALFQSDMDVGGIQRSLVNIVSSLDDSDCVIDVFLFRKSHFFPIKDKPGLNIIYLNPYPYFNRFVYFDILRRFAKELNPGVFYDVAVDFNTYQNECALGALSVNAKKRVMWIHNDVEIKKANEPKFRILWHFFRKKMRYFDEFAAVSPGIVEGFRRVYGVKDKKIHVIPNFINSDEIMNARKEPVDFKVDPQKYNVASMGRLCHQKGFDILLGYFAQVVERRQDIHLYLIGEGPDQQKLEKQVSDTRLSGFVTFLGNQKNPFPYMDQMDGFALTSRYEGQGMVIWEAKALGLELFVAKNLEQYNQGITGCEDITAALIAAKKRKKTPDRLDAYNKAVLQGLKNLLDLNGEAKG